MPRRSILVFEMGYAHGSGFALKLWAKGRTMGPAQNLRGALRRGRASPHIGRRSRSRWGQVQHRLLISKTVSHIRRRSRSAWINLLFDRSNCHTHGACEQTFVCSHLTETFWDFICACAKLAADRSNKPARMDLLWLI